MSPREAYSKVKWAVRSGKLVRPSTCQGCGRAPGVGIDGRSLLHAHHHDYALPLEVEWLCVKCHRKETRLPRGVRNGNAALSPGLVSAAKILVGEGFAIADIAEFYGVGRSGLSHALNGRTSWLAERAKGGEA